MNTGTTASEREFVDRVGTPLHRAGHPDFIDKNNPRIRYEIKRWGADYLRLEQEERVILDIKAGLTPIICWRMPDGSWIDCTPYLDQTGSLCGHLQPCAVNRLPGKRRCSCGKCAQTRKAVKAERAEREAKRVQEYRTRKAEEDAAKLAFEQEQTLNKRNADLQAASELEREHIRKLNAEHLRRVNGPIYKKAGKELETLKLSRFCANFNTPY